MFLLLEEAIFLGTAMEGAQCFGIGVIPKLTHEFGRYPCRKRMTPCSAVDIWVAGHS